jgi:hypothetical protein
MDAIQGESLILARTVSSLPFKKNIGTLVVFAVGIEFTARHPTKSWRHSIAEEFML